MTGEYRVRYDPMARVALQEAAAYIAGDSGPDRAAAWLRSMREGIQKLKSHPRAFAAATLHRGRPIHSKLVISHRVFYFVDDPTRTVYVVDIIHTARDTRLAKYRTPTG